MTESAAAPDDQLHDLLDETRATFQRTLRGRAVLLAGIVISASLCTWIASLFSIPNERGFTISLLQQPHWLISLFVVFIAVIVSMFIARMITRSIRPEAALVCAGFGLASISLRGGPMQTTLFAASGAGIFIAMAVEVALAFAFLLAAEQLAARFSPPNSPAQDADLDEQLLAVFAHAASMTVLMMLVCRSDAKMQALLSVGVCAAVSSFIARQIVTMRSIGWLWLSPLLVALIGYTVAWFHPETMQIGILHGPFAPLARPLPLDYAGMGTAGTVIGVWMGGGEEGQGGDEEE